MHGAGTDIVTLYKYLKNFNYKIKMAAILPRFLAATIIFIDDIIPVKLKVFV